MTVDPFKDSVIARANSNPDDAQNDARMPQNRQEWKSRNEKTPGNKRLSEYQKAKNDPNGVRTRVAGVKGRSPRPLDDGAADNSAASIPQKWEFLRSNKLNCLLSLRQGHDFGQIAEIVNQCD